MDKNKILYFVSTTAVIFLLSCQGLSVFFPPTPRPKADWLIKWLENPECRPPCYQSIVPGESTLEYAQARFKKVPNMEIIDVSFPEDYDFTDLGQITWGYKNSNDSGIAYTFPNKLVISYIDLVVYEDVLINEVIEIYGPPSHVWFIDCRAEIGKKRCSAELVYIDIGLSLGLPYQEVSDVNSSVDIKENQIFRIIKFFPPGMDGFCSSISDCNQDNLAEWKGFGVYPVKP